MLLWFCDARQRRGLLCGALLLCALPAAAAPRAVATVAPLHSLLAAVTDGVAEPTLLLDAAASPHALSLRPSQLRALADADIVFWFGAPLEPFLRKPLATLGVRHDALIDGAGLTLLPGRRGGVWSDAQDHGHAHDAARQTVDPHVWLDPVNGAAIARRIAEVLAALDPAHADIYAANAAALRARLDALQQTLRQRLEPVRTRPYLVFHDAYQYFEKRFGLRPVGAIALEPSRPPGARRLREIAAALRASGARCVFAEPQFPARLLTTLAADGSLRVGVLDPLGSALTPGPALYPQLLENLADDLLKCLQS